MRGGAFALAVLIAALPLASAARAPLTSPAPRRGRGRAIDDGGPVLATMRREACGPFNTVPGSGSDSYHRDHLHFDTARGRGLYCG